MSRILVPLLLLPFALGQSQSAPDTCKFVWPTILSANTSISPPFPVFKTFGTPESLQTPSSTLLGILSQISPSRINNTITNLVSFGTRSTLSDKVSNATYGIGGARDWIAKEMRSYIASSGGKLSVSTPSYIQAPASRIPVSTNISDVVGVLTGSTDPGRVYVISGHYDSRVTDVEDFTSPAPGANDDASGVAVMLEAARVLSALTGQGQGPLATIIFVAVAGEEQGLYGSTFLANTLKANGTDVQGMLNNDIVGSSTAETGSKDPFSIRLYAQGSPTTESAAQASLRVANGGEADSPTRQLARFVSSVAQNAGTAMNVHVISRTDRFLRGGDHEPFLSNGWPAVRFTEPQEDFRHQHQDVRIAINPNSGQPTQFGDLIEFVDFDFTARVGRVNTAALYSLANAPGTPRNAALLVNGILTNNSTITWAAPSNTVASQIKGYEVVWREPTDALWSHFIEVGNVLASTVLLSKDDVMFGVRSVGKNGMKSPVAWAFPNGT